MIYEYIVNADANIETYGRIILSSLDMIKAIQDTNQEIKKLKCATKETIDVFEVLGMRNLSSFVGEVLCKNIGKHSSSKLIKNPHQDGYPDLLIIDNKESQEYFASITSFENGEVYPKEKNLFNPYKYGGIEVKATCGSTPSAKEVNKPLIGQQRIDLLANFDWKAHHRETNNLVGILWDFIGKLPIITACFFSNDLEEKDWGNIVQPKKGGGRTTSVSIMKASGIKRMCKNWIVVIDDDKYTEFLSAEKWIGYNIKKGKAERERLS